MDRNRRAIQRKITTLFGTSVPPALPNNHENNPKASGAFALRPYLSAMRLGAGVQLIYVLVDSVIDRNRRAILRKITTLFGTSVLPALPNDHENDPKASGAFALRPYLSAMRLGADVKSAFVLADRAIDRNRRAILRKITTLFGTSVPPALPNDHKNSSKASGAFALRPYLSGIRLGAGVHLVYVLADRAKDRNRREILRRIITLFGTSVPPALPNVHENNPKASGAFALRPYLSAMRLGAGAHLCYVLVDTVIDRNRRAILRRIITLFCTSVPPALPNNHKNTPKASGAFALRPYLSATRLRAGAHLFYVFVDSAIDRNRRAILRKITTLFGTSVPPALPIVHENTPKASRTFSLRPYLSAMRLGAGALLCYVLVDSAIDRNRRAILRKITTLFDLIFLRIARRFRFTTLLTRMLADYTPLLRLSWTSIGSYTRTK